jgi:uncharacterized protein (DUF1786 family)
MRILAVDIGTGTQDILLFDSRVDVENSFKMVLPSPTMIAHRRLKEATRRGAAVVLTGVTMGGGPSNWAAEAHIQAGYDVFATPDAGRSFNDDLNFIQELGIKIISNEEVSRLPEDIVRIALKDFDFNAIKNAFEQFNVSLSDLDVIAAAVFDHGAAPPGYSDRQFRFDYISDRVKIGRQLSNFAYRADDIPEIMTRMKAVSFSTRNVDIPLVVMDTAPAAVLGAMLDPVIQKSDRFVLVNVGNFHTIAFRHGQKGIEGVFEHHTGMLDGHKLSRLLEKLAKGTLKHEEIFNDQGHGALILEKGAYPFGIGEFDVAVTGPRRLMMRDSELSTHFATPFGDMMLAGCFGLVRAVGDLMPENRGEIKAALTLGREKPPWELD